MQKINFTSDGQNVEGTLFIPNNGQANPGVIFFHGSGSNQGRYLSLAEALCKNNIAALTFNIRGHDSSEGLKVVTAYDGITDAVAAYDFFIQQKGVDQDRIGVCGSSFGAVLATHLQEKRKIKSILLRVPALYKEEMMKVNLGKFLESEDRIFNDMDNIKDTEMMKKIALFEGSLLVVASEKDELIPAPITQAFFDEAKKARRKEFKVIKNAPHAIKDPAHREELQNITIQWFAETL